MLASLLMVLCLQMAAQTWEEVKVGTSIRKTLTYVPNNVDKSPALVISLHGMNQDPGVISRIRRNGMRWLIPRVLSLLIRWVITRCGILAVLGDVKFVEAIMKDMELKHNVDQEPHLSLGLLYG